MNYIEKYKHWLGYAKLDSETKNELLAIKENDIEIKERFHGDLEFGTGGLRGVLGAGTNRINRYTIQKTTQGFANYIKSCGADACARGVVIAHDNRRYSREFCLVTAGVLAANGIKSYIFDMLRPTPELSYAVRTLGTFGGVMITASHNPPEYNGYKLYDERGCQLVPAVNDLIVAEIENISDPLTVKSLSVDAAGGLIILLDSKIDEKYYNAVTTVAINPDIQKSDLKIVYSPQHGTGNIPVRTVLERMGYNVIPVTEQCDPDTEFSCTKNPNPESPDAYILGIEYAKKSNADIVITTDPDCDRLGVAVKQKDDYILMTGNHSAAVLLEYILSERKKKGNLPSNGIVFNTIVTSDLGDRICEKYGVAIEKTLTGFKYIGDKIYEYERTGNKKFVFGFEESYGCLAADFVRDKDAVQASLLLCEAAAFYKEKSMTLIDVLNSLYAEYGYYLDALDNFGFKGIEASATIAKLISNLRTNPPKEAAGVKIAAFEDYESVKMAEEGFPASNVLKFLLEDGSWVAVRPSGTEPKCKFYFSVVAENKAAAEIKLVGFRKVFEGTI